VEGEREALGAGFRAVRRLELLELEGSGERDEAEAAASII
jgi:hypothetical protein